MKVFFKNFFKKYFESFAYFFSYLRFRIFIIIAFSIFIGILDGFGLTMFLPLLQMVNDSTSFDPESMGKLSFLVDFLTGFGISLSLLPVLILMMVFFFGKGIVQYISGIYN